MHGAVDAMNLVPKLRESFEREPRSTANVENGLELEGLVNDVRDPTVLVATLGVHRVEARVVDLRRVSTWELEAEGHPGLGG